MSSHRTAARLITFGVGLTCLASAWGFRRRPRAATRAVHLPESAGLGRWVAARDLTIGLLLLVPGLQRPALALRGASDALDAGLMASAVLRGQRSLASSGLFIAGALALSGLGLALRAQLGDQAARRARRP